MSWSGGEQILCMVEDFNQSDRTKFEGLLWLQLEEGLWGWRDLPLLRNRHGASDASVRARSLMEKSSLPKNA